MVKHLLPILATILCITTSHQLFAIDDKAQKEINISTTFKMKVLYDGLPSDESLFVSLKIYSSDDKIHAKWVHAYFKLFEETGVGMRIQQFTTFNDSITDLEVDDNSFEFNLHFNQKSPLKIVGTEKNNDYYLEGIGFWWDDTANRKVKVKWHSTDTIQNYHTNREKTML